MVKRAVDDQIIMPTLRAAKEKDMAVLINFMREYYQFDNHTFRKAMARRSMKGLLRNTAFGKVWLIIFRKRTIGYVVLTYGYSLEYLGRDAFVDEIFILPEYRGKGIGKKVLKEVEDHASKNDVKAVHLEVSR